MDIADLFDQDEIDEYLRSPEVIEACMDLAEEAADYWKSIAPQDSGDYRDSIHAARFGDDVYVVCDDPAANVIEYGSEDTPEFACRARTEAHFNER